MRESLRRACGGRGELLRPGPAERLKTTMALPPRGSSMSTAELKHKLLELLKVDEEFRLAVAGLIGLGDVLRRLEEHDKKFNEIIERLKEHDKKFYKVLERLDRHEEELIKLREDMNRGFKRHDEELAKLREDMQKGFERHDKELARLREDMNKGFELLRRHIDALGARWGLDEVLKHGQTSSTRSTSSAGLTAKAGLPSALKLPSGEKISFSCSAASMEAQLG